MANVNVLIELKVLMCHNIFILLTVPSTKLSTWIHQKPQSEDARNEIIPVKKNGPKPECNYTVRLDRNLRNNKMKFNVGDSDIVQGKLHRKRP